jgi:hypothetical protein
MFCEITCVVSMLPWYRIVSCVVPIFHCFVYFLKFTLFCFWSESAHLDFVISHSLQLFKHGHYLAVINMVIIWLLSKVFSTVA